MSTTSHTIAPHPAADTRPPVTVADSPEAVTLAGTTLTFLIESRQTGGAWSMLAYDAAPGFVAAAPHTHARTTEAFYVVSGTLTVRLGAHELEAPAGARVVIPPGTSHTFRNRSDERARFLSVASPGGHDDFLRELLALIAAAPSWPPSDPTALVALASRYDTTYDAP